MTPIFYLLKEDYTLNPKPYLRGTIGCSNQDLHLKAKLTVYEFWAVGLEFRGLGITIWGLPGTPKICKIRAFMAVSLGLRLLFYILLGFR